MHKQYRLRKNKEFQWLYRKGKSVAARELVLIYAPSRTGLKAGFSVSSKIGKAVTRNLIKRRLREALGQNLERISHKHGYVFVARGASKDCSFARLKETMEQLLVKAGLYDNERT